MLKKVSIQQFTIIRLNSHFALCQYLTLSRALHRIYSYHATEETVFIMSACCRASYSDESFHWLKMSFWRFLGLCVSMIRLLLSNSFTFSPPFLHSDSTNFSVCPRIVCCGVYNPPKSNPRPLHPHSQHVLKIEMNTKWSFSCCTKEKDTR